MRHWLLPALGLRIDSGDCRRRRNVRIVARLLNGREIVDCPGTKQDAFIGQQWMGIGKHDNASFLAVFMLRFDRARRIK